MSLRQRNRLHTMRLVQTTGVAMFEADGFEATTVEAVADDCRVSASTIYRHFGTKEHIVLWDERDSIINDELNRRLRTQTPIDAFRDAAIAAFTDRHDAELLLRRLKLTYADPGIWAAAAQQDRIDRAELAEGIAAIARQKTVDMRHDLIAAICLAALDTALDRWQQRDGTDDLADLIAEAFAVATSLE